jgi:hypothetical protein
MGLGCRIARAKQQKRDKNKAKKGENRLNYAFFDNSCFWAGDSLCL